MDSLINDLIENINPEVSDNINDLIQMYEDFKNTQELLFNNSPVINSDINYLPF
jgi:hypothetical protein